jgi:glycosyltransferase involved in cell wall biosynthesis
VAERRREPAIEVSAETAYPPLVPSPRVRLAGFVEHLAPYGVDLRYRPALTNDEYAVIASAASPMRKAAVVGRAAARIARTSDPSGLRLVHRMRFIAPLPGIEPARRLDAYDFDDAVYLDHTLSANRRFSWLKRQGARSIEYMRRARLVIAGSGYLADAARRWSEHVEVVPSCTDPTRFAVREHADRETLTVGWLGSQPTSIYLDRIVPVIERLNQRGMPTRLLLIGADRRISGRGIEHRAWSLESEVELLSEIDVGVMPMEDNEWARGKCGYKLLQYFSAGIPAVASPVGVATVMVGDGRGALAGSEAEWTDQLLRLGQDARLRGELGANARAFVEREYSYQRWAPELARMLQELAGA